jgi:hypothetical protein
MASAHKRITQLLFAWLAVTVLILSTACSNPGSPSHPAAAPTPAPNANQQRHNNPPKVVTATSTPEPTKMNDDLNSGSSDSSQEHSRRAGTDNSGPIDMSGISENTPQAIEQAGAASSKGMTPEQLFGDDGTTSAQLAAKMKDAYYSASSTDGLYEQIKGIEGKVKDEGRREANSNFAKHIVFSTFTVLPQNEGRASISIVNAQGQVTRHDFTGQLDRNLHMRSVSGGYTVDAVCMDATVGCKTVHIRIQEKGAVAHVLARNNDATLYIQGTRVGTVNNPEFDRLMRIMLNTVGSSGSPDSVNDLKLITSETINGPSKFAVTFGLYVNDRHSYQVLSWSGDLVKPAQSNMTDILLKPVFGLERGGIADTVREARLVRNDGKGDIQIVLNVRRGTATAEEGILRLTVSRIQTPVRELMMN